MDFYEVVDKVVDLLKQRGRVTYGAVQLQFSLDDKQVEVLKDELIHAQQVARDENNRVLVWLESATGQPLSPIPSTPPTSEPEITPTAEPEREPLSYTPPHLAEKILTTRSALEGERKQVTVLFCDLQNSTPLAEQIGPENMHALLNRFFELALNEVHRYKGTVNQFLGDGFMALFGAPISHEDHARRAVLAAIGLQRSLTEANPGEPYGVECAFRIGINSGLVVVGSIGDNLRMDYSAIGDTTNLAARLQTQSEPGEILVSETTARLVEGYIRLEALEPVEVKGKTEPVSTYEVIGTLPRRSPIVSRSERTLSQFVGRERELATLEELFAQVESGNGQVVGIVAEAGQGKSRVLYEFRQRLENKQVTYLEGRCLSYGSSIPYHPIIDVLRHNCGITETDSPEMIIEKVRAALQEVGMDAEASAPYLLQLLGVKEGTEPIAQLTPEAVRTRTFETLRQMSLSGAQQHPLIFEVEDLHWCDKTSEAYLSELVESLAGASILLLTTYRPGYQPPWLGKSYATQISLHSLTPRDALTIVHSTAHDQALPDHLAQTIVEKSEGNPFFLEELTQAVIEHGDFHSEMIVPDTVQGVLSARIDRLPEAHKRVLQTAAVLGREFSSRLLEAIWDDSGSLEALLLELKRMEFLFERTGAQDPIYVFKHALTQDVAYESLLTTRRQVLHAAAGQALETLYADRLEDAHDRLAYHYARTDNATKAVVYLTRVAEKATQHYAHGEAVALLQEAFVHAERLPEEERDYSMLDVAVHQSDSLYRLGRHKEIVDLLLGQQERLERLQEPLLTGQYYLGLGNAYFYVGTEEQIQQSLHRALEEGTRHRDAIIMGGAHAQLARIYGFSGNSQLHIAQAQQAVALLEGTEERRWLGTSLYLLGMAYSHTDNFQSALEVANRLTAIADASGDRRQQTGAATVAGMTYMVQGEWETAITVLRHALETSPDAFETAFVMGTLGYAYLEQGDLNEALPLIQEAVEQAQQYRSPIVQSTFKTYLGEAYRVVRQIRQARDFAHQGLRLAQDLKNLRGVGRAQHTLGRIAHTSGNLPESARCLQVALTTFENIQARYELARTHLDLASLAHDQGNQDTATTHLSTAYAWFKKLQVPKWVEKTEQLARDYGVTLTDVKLEEKLTEGSS